MANRVHILGASGSGTTTLGEAVAKRLGAPLFDSDSYFWLPSDPPFVSVRPQPQRLMLLLRDLPSQGGWVHSGSAIGWAKPLEPLYDLIVYLHLDPALRLARLKRREHARYGSRIAPDGDMTHTHAAFMKWAASYDTAGVEQRSRAAHEAWLARQTAPVLRLDAAQPIGDLASTVVSALS